MANIIQLLTGRGCNITLFGPLKGVIFPKWLYFPEARSTVILDSLVFFVGGGGGGGSIFCLPEILIFFFCGGGGDNQNYGKIICRDSSRKNNNLQTKNLGKKRKTKNPKTKIYPKKHFFGKKENVEKIISREKKKS